MPRKQAILVDLDPLATGVLPICLGQATKVSEYLLNSHKKYSTVIRLGQSTDTLDSEGEVIADSELRPSDDDIQTALAQFRGRIKQVPPMYSALKRDGQPLYKLARRGQEVERPAREMEVFDLQANQSRHRSCATGSALLKRFLYPVFSRRPREGSGLWSACGRGLGALP